MIARTKLFIVSLAFAGGCSAFVPSKRDTTRDPIASPTPTASPDSNASPASTASPSPGAGPTLPYLEIPNVDTRVSLPWAIGDSPRTYYSHGRFLRGGKGAVHVLPFEIGIERRMTYVQAASGTGFLRSASYPIAELQQGPALPADRTFELDTAAQLHEVIATSGVGPSIIAVSATTPITVDRKASVKTTTGSLIVSIFSALGPTQDAFGLPARHIRLTSAQLRNFSYGGLSSVSVTKETDRITVSASGTTQANRFGVCVFRLLLTGALDTSFGANGESCLITSGAIYARGHAVRPSGRVVVLTHVDGPDDPLAGPNLFGLSPSGIPDTAFAPNGILALKNVWPAAPLIWPNAMTEAPLGVYVVGEAGPTSKLEAFVGCVDDLGKACALAPAALFKGDSAAPNSDLAHAMALPTPGQILVSQGPRVYLVDLGAASIMRHYECTVGVTALDDQIRVSLRPGSTPSELATRHAVLVRENVTCEFETSF